MKTGRFITLEGTEGAGKSTLAEGIEQWLLDQGVDLVVSREPGGTLLGEKLRALLLDPDTGDLAVETELLLMFAARAEHIHRVILPALERGQWVLCDRFTDASFAYQGGGRGLSFTRLEVLENWLHPALQPDITFLLDLPVEQGLLRAGRRNAPDRFEREKQEFFSAVQGAYYRRMQQFPERIKKIDASRSEREVLAQALSLLEPLL